MKLAIKGYARTHPIQKSERQPERANKNQKQLGGNPWVRMIASVYL